MSKNTFISSVKYALTGDIYKGVEWFKALSELIYINYPFLLIDSNEFSSKISIVSGDSQKCGEKIRGRPNDIFNRVYNHIEGYIDSYKYNFDI